MYALTKDGQISRYPYTLVHLQEDHSETSFPDWYSLSVEMREQRLLEYGVCRVYGTQQPVFDELTHSLRELPPVETDGRWMQQWEVLPLPAEKVAANQAAAAQALQQSIVDATQRRLDEFARTRNYDGILSACTYATSTIPKFTAEGQYAVQARDATWAALYQFLADVQADKQPVPTGFEDVEPLLPELEWPQ